MLKMKVWHSDNFRKNSEWQIGKDALVFPLHYTPVALVSMSNDLVKKAKANGATPIHYCEYAFRLTNHIDNPWTWNNPVTVLAEGGRDAKVRSTSVGDVVEFGDKAFVVMPCGFEEIKLDVEFGLDWKNEKVVYPQGAQA